MDTDSHNYSNFLFELLVFPFGTSRTQQESREEFVSPETVRLDPFVIFYLAKDLPTHFPAPRFATDRSQLEQEQTEEAERRDERLSLLNRQFRSRWIGAAFLHFKTFMDGFVSGSVFSVPSCSMEFVPAKSQTKPEERHSVPVGWLSEPTEPQFAPTDLLFVPKETDSVTDESVLVLDETDLETKESDAEPAKTLLVPATNKTVPAKNHFEPRTNRPKRPSIA